MDDFDVIHGWCALWRTPRVGYKRFAKVKKVFGSPKAFFSASNSERERLGVKVDAAALMKAQQDADQDIKWLQTTANAHILHQDSIGYPKQLQTITDPPPVIFARGNITLLDEPQLAMVGSRSPSHEGIEIAYSFAKYLAKQGLVITSGMALGIDGESHKGALQSGETIAVMGTGPDRIYPARHHELAHEIIKKGVIITELPVGTPVRVDAFPRRNRIISGLSLGTLVVEASIKSGSLITARAALEQGREVFAIPGSIHNPQAKGCNYLIKNGAKLVETATDIFEELKPQLLVFVDSEKSATLKKETSSSQIENSNMAKEQPSLIKDSTQQALWDALSYEAQPVDVLVKRSGLRAGEISSMLLILELDGYVIKSVGGLYHKKGE